MHLLSNSNVIMEGRKGVYLICLGVDNLRYAFGLMRAEAKLLKS